MTGKLFVILRSAATKNLSVILSVSEESIKDLLDRSFASLRMTKGATQDDKGSYSG